MEKIFWVSCPACAKRFYADASLRDAQVRLWCPYCNHRFLPAEGMLPRPASSTS